MTQVKSGTLSRADQINQAVVNKLIRPRHLSNADASKHQARTPSQYELYPIVQDSMERINDADKIFDILPDLQQVAEIAISGILSSKDLVTTVVNYDCDADEIPLELRSDLIKAVKNHFETVHPFKEYLHEILYDVLFKTGSYAVAILPESSIDKLINGNAGKVAIEALQSEAISRLSPYGILGNPNKTYVPKVGLEAIYATPEPLTTENYRVKLNDALPELYITDNPNILAIHKLRDEIAKRKIESAYNSRSFGVESTANQPVPPNGGNANQKPIRGFDYKDNDVYKDGVYGLQAVVPVDLPENVGRKSVGRPMIQHIPSEAVIPVHVPGNMKHHIGYFVMLDETGNPIDRHSLLNNSIAMNFLTGNASSKVIQDVALNMGFGTTPGGGAGDKWTIQRLRDAYTDMVEAKLINALKNGTYGDGVTMCRPQEAYSVMMARSLSKRATQMLYIPAEQFSYFALDYNDWGVGRSLLDRNKMLSTIRSAAMFATISGMTLNATRNLVFNLELDPDDHEPEKTIEDAQHRIMEQFANQIPMRGNPDDIMAYMARAGISWSITGNENYPSTKIEMHDDTPDYKLPDNDVVESLARQHYRGLMVDPDLILNPQNIEFASQITSKDLINTKRICKTQERLSPLMTHYCKTVVYSDSFLKEELAEIAKTYLDSDKNDEKSVEKVNQYLTLFVEKLKVTLPPPDTSMLNSQAQSFEDYSNALDKWVDLWCSQENLAGTEYEGNADQIKTMIKNYILRIWMRKNDIDKDLLDVLDADNIQESIVNMSTDNINITQTLVRFFKRYQTRLETLAENEGVSAPAESEDFGGGTDDSSGEFGGEGEDNGFGGGEDVPFGGDEFGTDEGDDLDGVEGDDLEHDDNLSQPDDGMSPDDDLADHADSNESQKLDDAMGSMDDAAAEDEDKK